MKVFRHHYVTEDNEPVFDANFFERSQEQVAPLGGVQPRLSLVTAAGDEVQISGTVITLQTPWHEVRLNLTRLKRCDGRHRRMVEKLGSLCPPLAKAARSGAPDICTPCLSYFSALNCWIEYFPLVGCSFFQS